MSTINGAALPPRETLFGTKHAVWSSAAAGCRSAHALKAGDTPLSGAGPGRKVGRHMGPSAKAAADARDMRASSCAIAETARCQSAWLAVKHCINVCVRA